MATVTFIIQTDMSLLRSSGRFNVMSADTVFSGYTRTLVAMDDGGQNGIGLVGDFNLTLQSAAPFAEGTASALYFYIGHMLPRFQITGMSYTFGQLQFDHYVTDANQAGLVSYILGGRDVIYGSPAADTLKGFGGDDVLIGGAGGDRLDGGSGNNTASYVNASAGLFAGISDAFYNTGEADDDTYVNIHNLIGSSFNDVLYGDAGANRLYGGPGNDKFAGKGLGDLFDGGAGVDKVSHDASGAVRASLLNPTINTGDSAGDRYVAVENLAGSSYSDVLYGDNLANTIEGNDYPNLVPIVDADQLFGLGGNDGLLGYYGEDRLTGGPGADRLTGGLGADDFIFNGFTESWVAGGRDYIVDFNRAEGDDIWLNAIDANTRVAGNQAFIFIGALAFSGRAGELRYQIVSGDSYIFGDLNGDKAFDMHIISNNPMAFIAADFVL